MKAPVVPVTSSASIGDPEFAPLDLTRLLEPAAIALVGASTNPQVTSGQPLRYMKEFGFGGRLYPVNPRRSEVQGLRSYERIASLPEPCDIAVITVAAPQVPAIIRECGEAGIPFAVVLTAGFEETGATGAVLQKELRDAVSESGVRVVGPNSTGIVNLRCRSYCAQGGALSEAGLQPGPVAVVSQSGGVGLSILSFLQSAGVGASYLLSSGNEVDLDVFDFAGHLLRCPDVSTIALYLESSISGRKLRALGRRALEAGKPIVVLKAGNTGAARAAATSHTGRLTADYQLFRTAFREGGYIEVGDIDELVDVTKAVSGGMRTKGARAAVLTTSGGWGVMLAEQCEARGLTLPPLAPETIAAIKPLVPSYASLGNPVDITPQGYKDQYASYNEITRLLLADPNVDLVVVRSATGSDIGAWADRLIQIVEGNGKAVLVHWAPSARRFLDVKERLERCGIVCFPYVNQIAAVAAAVVDFSARRDACAAGAVTIMPAEKAAVPPLVLRNSPGLMGEAGAMECLRAYGIAVAKSRLVPMEGLEALDLADFAFPVAVKIESDDLPHKTEAGGVVLNVAGAAQVREAARRVLDRVRAKAPTAVINGILVQEMATGLEVIVGAVSDPHFGPIVMFGMGGVFAEVMNDVSYRFAPIDRSEALRMVREVKGGGLLDGARGQPPRDLEALAQAIVAISRLIADYRDTIAEIEINPLFVRAVGAGVSAADCLIRTGSRSP
jgi:acyl-CoA synthetase (NDP forming)